MTRNGKSIKFLEPDYKIRKGTVILMTSADGLSYYLQVFPGNGADLSPGLMFT